MNLHHLRYMAAISDYGTMTAAARALHVAQPALSQAIQQLERELDVALFTRRGRTLQLTDAGREIVATARRVLDELDHLDERVASQKHRAATLTLAGRAGVMYAFGVRTIASFTREHRDLVVRVCLEDDRQELTRRLRDGDIDLALTDLPLEDPRFVDEQLGEQEFDAYLPPGTTCPVPITVPEFGHYAQISAVLGDPRRETQQRAALSVGSHFDTAIECDSPELALRLTAADVGATILHDAFRDAAHQLGVVVVPLDPPVRRPFGIVRRAGAMRAPVEAFWTHATTSSVSR